MYRFFVILILLFACPLWAGDVTYTDKVTGGQFTAADANNVKDAINSKADQVDLDAANVAMKSQVATKWEVGRDYTADNNMLAHDGHIFLCTVSHTASAGTEPGTGASWQTVWKYSGEDLSGTDIKTAYEAQADTNAFTDAEKAKLLGIEEGATAGGSDADDTAYSASTWDGNSDAATKNAIRDKFESLSGSVTVAQDLETPSTTAVPSVDAVKSADDLKQDKADIRQVEVDGSTIGLDVNAGTVLDPDILQIKAGGVGAAHLAEEYVQTTGNETVAGVKTFSSSPIVPTPTNGSQVANKDYVDANSGTGTFSFDTFPLYEDSAHSSGIARNATSGAMWNGTKWLTFSLTDSLDPAPASYSLTMAITDATGTGSTFTVDSISATVADTPKTWTGLSSATQAVTFAPNSTETSSCTGTGVTGSNPNWVVDMSSANVTDMACTVSAASGGCASASFYAEEDVSHDRSVASILAQTFVGSRWISATPSPQICSAEVYVGAVGDVSSYDWVAVIYRGGNGVDDVGTLSATSVSVGGSSIPASGTPGWVTFEFATTQAALDQYDIVAITRSDNSYDASNYLDVYFDYNGANSLQDVYWRTGGTPTFNDDSMSMRLHAPN